MDNANVLFDLNELNRRLANIVSKGTIVSVNYSAATCRVTVGELTTTDIPWLTDRAGNNITWWSPDVGEQVVVLAPSGDLNQGVVIRGALYQDRHRAPTANKHLHRINYANGSYIEHDTTSGDYTLSVTGNLNLIAAGNVTINGSRVDIN